MLDACTHAHVRYIMHAHTHDTRVHTCMCMHVMAMNASISQHFPALNMVFYDENMQIRPKSEKIFVLKCTDVHLCTFFAHNNSVKHIQFVNSFLLHFCARSGSRSRSQLVHELVQVANDEVILNDVAQIIILVDPLQHSSGPAPLLIDRHPLCCPECKCFILPHPEATHIDDCGLYDLPARKDAPRDCVDRRFGLVVGQLVSLEVNGMIRHRFVLVSLAQRNDGLDALGRRKELDVGLLVHVAVRFAPTHNLVVGSSPVDPRLRVDGEEAGLVDPQQAFFEGNRLQQDARLAPRQPGNLAFDVLRELVENTVFRLDLFAPHPPAVADASRLEPHQVVVVQVAIRRGLRVAPTTVGELVPRDCPLQVAVWPVGPEDWPHVLLLSPRRTGLFPGKLPDPLLREGC
mmetsp:Transcript_13060/g.23710  ORF Transcript_13060/g.23710 Transcript_13060/m.23710 type:complete len:403 (+) Transcript_13060:73-1281(+)